MKTKSEPIVTPEMTEELAIESNTPQEPEVTAAKEPEVPVTQEPETTGETTFPYAVKIVSETLYCHRGPGKAFPVISIVRGEEIHLIVDEALGGGASKWGKLKGENSYWISLDHCVKVK